jgi:hypothetical protein
MLQFSSGVDERRGPWDVASIKTFMLSLVSNIGHRLPVVSEASGAAYRRKITLTRLSLHRAHSSVLEEEPVVRLIPLPRALRKANLVFGIIAFHQVLHDASRLEEIDWFAVGEGVSQCWNAPIGVDSAEPRFFLGIFADLDLLGLVWNTVTSGKYLQ